jgi:2-phosphoglycerate kinase
MQTPEYRFIHPETVLFITGVPLSGKSSITPLIAASIEGCTIQPMDIFRLISQKLEAGKPEKERNPFVQVGSCDSYIYVGNGRYTAKNLITGFNKYAKAVSSILEVVVPKLEAQGVQNIIFEGVQLTPRVVAPYLKNPNNRLIIVTASEEKLAENRQKLYKNDRVLQERYSGEKLMLLQDEILTQGRALSMESYMIVNNVDKYSKAAVRIMQYLSETGIITALKKKE